MRILVGHSGWDAIEPHAIDRRHWTGGYHPRRRGRCYRSHDLLVMWIIRSALHVLKVVRRELLFHLSHLCTESINILVRVSLPSLEGVVLQKELLKFVGRIEVCLLLLLTGNGKVRSWVVRTIGQY
jgi:hypothetical protein